MIAVVNEENSKYYIEQLKNNKENTKNELKRIMKTFDSNEKAIGIILLEKGAERTKINPIIWVKTIDTLCYETACGSGSLAATIYKNYIEGIENLELLQPSGYSINVNISKKQDYLQKATISGKIIEEE